MKRPELTFTAEVAAYVTEAYRAADCILEYGSGGSTVLASEMPGKTIYSVESDKAWAERLDSYIAQSPETLSRPEVIYADIGPTRAWGWPETNEHYARFPTYPLGFWCRDARQEPDLVLIDGRFRVACFLATAMMLVRPALVLWDDYLDRSKYHWIERIAKPARIVGRMACFEMEPSMAEKRLLLNAVQAALDPS